MTKRPLTTGEQDILRALFQDSVDLSKVAIKNGGWLTWTGNFVTINNTIYWPKAHAFEDLSSPEVPALLKAVLFHEVVHVWQYQNRQHPSLKGYTWRSALWEHLTQRDPYAYQPEDHARLTDYGFEQQGRIVQNAVYARLQGQSANRLDAIIRHDIPTLSAP